MLMMVVDARRRRTVGLLVLLVPLGGRPGRAEVLGFSLDSGYGRLLGLGAQGQGKSTLEALTRTVGLLVVLVEEVVKLATRAFRTLRVHPRRSGRLLHQELLAHDTSVKIKVRECHYCG